LHRASIVYEIEQYRQKTVETPQNIACNLDAGIPAGVSRIEDVFRFSFDCRCQGFDIRRQTAVETAGDTTSENGMITRAEREKSERC
jgi:hypothetical protein